MALFIQILQIAAFVLFLLAGININPGKVSVGWLGAACAMLAFLLVP